MLSRIAYHVGPSAQPDRLLPARRRTRPRARLRRRAAGGDCRRRRARPSTSTAPPSSASATGRSTRRSAAIPHALHYALKANSTLAIARLLRELGSARRRELGVGNRGRAQRAGFSPSQIVFTGVGKSPDGARARRRARRQGDQRRVGGRAGARSRRSPRGSGGAVRVARPRQPGHRRQEPSAHFDRPQDQQVRRAARRCARAAGDAARRARRCAWWRSTSTSGRRSPRSIRCAAPPRVAADLSLELQRAGSPLEYVDLGGGLGVSYDGADVPSAGRVRRMRWSARCAGRRCRSCVEPGRSIAAPAGALLARVIDVKPRTATSEFVIIDAGMTELMRPALYNAFHRIEPVRGPAAGDHHYEIVGPVCESSDVVGRDRMLPPLAAGDLVAIRDAGAYGSVDGLELQSSSAAGRSAGRRRRVARHPPPPDAWTIMLALETRPSSVQRPSSTRSRADQADTSSRSRGSIRAASRRRPSCCATACKQDGRKARLVSFPDYGTSIGEEIARALAGEREYGADVMQLLYVANRYERKAGPRAVARRRADPGLRPLYGVERRLRRGAWASIRRGSPTCSSCCRRRR